MKPNLFAFLLVFLLLVDKSHGAGQSIMDKFLKVFKGLDKAREAVDRAWDKGGKDFLKAHLSPPPVNLKNPSFQTPKAPPVIKEYLSDFGYLQDSESYNNVSDQDTESAIKTYQKNFNLQVTGNLSKQTLQQMVLLRCGVPDTNFNYSFTENVSWPKSGNQWFKRKGNLTYSFSPESEIPPNATKVFKDAFGRWARATGVWNLTETKNYDNADIKVGFYNLSGAGVGDRILGASLIISDPDSKVMTGVIHLDGDKGWAPPGPNDTVSWKDEILDLETAAMHQIGHLLGFDHSFDPDSVMYPYILPSQQIKVELSTSDTNSIQQLYPNAKSGNANSGNANSGNAERWRLMVTILSLAIGFACSMVLFY